MLPFRLIDTEFGEVGVAELLLFHVDEAMSTQRSAEGFTIIGELVGIGLTKDFI